MGSKAIVGEGLFRLRAILKASRGNSASAKPSIRGPFGPPMRVGWVFWVACGS